VWAWLHSAEELGCRGFTRSRLANVATFLREIRVNVTVTADSGQRASGRFSDSRNTLNYAHEFAQQRELDPQLFEFKMLHGATPNRLKQMLDNGYRVRDYLPYGREWYLYVCHRLAEYRLTFTGHWLIPYSSEL